MYLSISQIWRYFFQNQSRTEISLTLGFLILISVTITCYAYSILEHDYQNIIKLLGICLLASSAIFALLFFRTKFTMRSAFITILSLNILFLLLAYLHGYEVGGPRQAFRIGFTYSNFWDFYYQLLTVSDETYTAIATGYLPFSWLFAKLYAVLDGWSGNGPDLKASTKLYYFSFFLISVAPLLLFANAVRERWGVERALAFTLFVAISYPIIFVFERGNFVLLSFGFLTLAVYAHWRKNQWLTMFFFSAFFSLKVVNFLLILTYARTFGMRKLFLMLSLALAIQTVSLFLVTGDISQWQMFAEAFYSPFQGMLNYFNITPISKGFEMEFIVTDGGRLQGMTSVDTIRVLVFTILNDVKLNLTSITPELNLLYNFVGVIALVYYFLRHWRSFDFYTEIIALLTLLMFIHTGSAEYNLILLIPLILIYCLMGVFTIISM